MWSFYSNITISVTSRLQGLIYIIGSYFLDIIFLIKDKAHQTTSLTLRAMPMTLLIVKVPRPVVGLGKRLKKC